MVILLAEAVRHLAAAFDGLAGDGDATALADAAIKGQRRVEHVVPERDVGVAAGRRTCER